MHSDTPDVDNGSTREQNSVGAKTLVINVYGMKADKKFVNAFEDNIRKRGVMGKLMSDTAQSETSNRVKDILLTLFNDDWQSEPHYQHQEFAERRF